ncbi:DsrE family protein [Pectinatus sottacetonis]|uniref:DsrE family protein n=1 Tax=Pectinatus sottacetonis TaxID=1002795 RepID=UPI0018C8237D|nr:DsrE family protein [Pectinatus sottacetonis]
MLKVVFHINELNKWEMTLGNIKNLFKDAGQEKSQVSLVANGEAVRIITMAKKDKAASAILYDIKILSSKNVKMFFCHNALRGNDIETSIVPEYIEVVPAGITKLIYLQQNGCAYIKP